MATGSVGVAGRRNLILAVLLIAVIVVCALITLRLPADNRSWIVGLQVISAVAGAALGNFLRLDFAASTVQNQARPAIRRLFDQAGRLANMASRVERNRAYILTQTEASIPVDPGLIADWLEVLSVDLREEINSAATSIDDWGDLAPDTRAAEVSDYTNRNQRLPRQLSGDETEAAGDV